ncbi:MAG: glycosyltransferase family 2 protein [Prevotella sp.]|nr:glycosyltransferase family 2 protein [Prevotella sp.]
MNNIKYTFLLPAYKARFFEEALLSIKNQTYRDFKVIVSDDCSPEELKPIYDKVCGDDPRFTFRRNEENMGSKSLVSHWNLLVDMCDTEWLIMAGDDDVYDPTFLDEMNRLSEKYPKVNLLHARARVIDADGEVTKLDSAYDEYVSQIEFLAFLGKIDHIECVGNYVYRTSVLKKQGGFVDLPLAWASDAATNNKMSREGCATSVNFLFHFRMSGVNISSTGNESNQVSKDKIRAVLMFDEDLESLFSSFVLNNKLLRHQYDVALTSQKMVVSTTLWAHSSILKFNELTKVIKHLKRRGYIRRRYEVYKLWHRWLYARLR